MSGGARPAGRSTSRSRSHDRTRVTITETGDGLIGADVAFGDDDLSADGGPKLDAILALANDLAARGAALDLAAGEAILPVETSIRRFGRGGPRRLAATARRLQRSASTMVWHVTLTAGGARDEPLAVVTQTQAIEGHGTERPRHSRAAATRPDVAVRQDAPRPEPDAVSPRREQIAAAAADIIARKGFAGASIREIADAAGLHVPTLYQYVASKDELLELVYSRTMAALQTDLETEVAGYDGAERKLRAAIAILLGQGDRFRHRIGLLNRELKSLSPLARTRVLDQYRELLDSLAAIIRIGVASGEFRAVEPAIAANLATAASDMWALRQFAVGRFGVAAYGAEITELIVSALRSTRGPPERP